MTVAVRIPSLQFDQVAIDSIPEMPPLPDLDVTPLPPALSGRHQLRAAPSQDVVGPGSRFLEVLERPEVRLAATRCGRVGERSEDPDARFTGAVVLGPGAGRPKMNDAEASQEHSESGCGEAGSIVRFQDQRRAVPTKEASHRERDLVGRTTGKGNPRNRVARGQIANGQDRSSPAFNRFGWRGQVDGPYGTGPLPGELIQPRPAAPTMAEAVRAEMPLEGTPGHPWHEGPKRGHADVRSHSPKDVVDEIGCVRVELF